MVNRRAWGTLRPPTVAVGGGGLDAATTAWKNAVITAGGTVSATQETRVDTLIVALKAASLWSTDGKLDHLWLYAGESVTQQAAIDIVGLLAHTVVGSPAFAAGGYTGGTGKFIWPNFNNNASGDNYGSGANTGSSMGCYCRTNTKTGYMMGTEAVSVHRLIVDPTDYAHALGNRSIIFTSGLSAAAMHTVSGDDTDIRMYRNATNIASSTPAGAFFFDAWPIYILARFNGVDVPPVAASADSFCSEQLACAYFGGNLSSTNVSDLYTAIQAYMTAWGVQV